MEWRLAKGTERQFAEFSVSAVMTLGWSFNSFPRVCLSSAADVDADDGVSYEATTVN